MCIQHERYHIPEELRKVAYRICGVSTEDTPDNKRRKKVALLLLKQATTVGLIDYLRTGETALGKHERIQIEAHVRSWQAAYSQEAYDILQGIDPEDEPPF
jgi:hypothetical protein